MEPIIRAILDSNLPEVRRLMATDAEAAWTKSESGRTPVQVAHAAGNFPVTAAILRITPQCIDEITTSPRELVEDLIRDFSQSTLCSGWNENIEFDLWALVIDDPEYKRDYDRYLSIDRESLSDIGWIASWAEGWFHWPDSEDSPKFIPMADWEERYREKTKR
jgi:hypothetical protein